MRFIIPLVLCTACSPASLVDDNEALWAANGSPNYSMTVQRSCFCAETDPVDVVVEAGEVVSAVRQTDEGPEDLDPDGFEAYFSVPGLFGIAAEAESGADEVVIEYDAALGYPTLIDIDWVRNAVDDEEQYSVLSLSLE